VVWTTIARSHGGTVQGIGVGQLAAYYVVWTLVRGWNVVFNAFRLEWRVREGELSASMLRPIHADHFELALVGGTEARVARHVRAGPAHHASSKWIG